MSWLKQLHYSTASMSLDSAFVWIDMLDQCLFNSASFVASSLTNVRVACSRQTLACPWGTRMIFFWNKRVKVVTKNWKRGKCGKVQVSFFDKSESQVWLWRIDSGSGCIESVAAPAATCCPCCRCCRCCRCCPCCPGLSSSPFCQVWFTWAKMLMLRNRNWTSYNIFLYNCLATSLY